MNELFNPITLLFVFLIGIALSIKYFFKEKNIFRKIGLVFIIFILISAIDSITMNIFFAVNKLVLPISIIGFISTMYFEDLYNYKMYKKITKKELIKNTLKYLYVVVFFMIMIYWFCSK